MLRRSIEVGRIDILTEISSFISTLVLPKKGNLENFKRIFRYLHKNFGKKQRRMAYDPMYEPTDENVFEVVGRDLDEWKNFYPDSKEMIPRHMLEALVKYAVIKAYMDANNAGNMANR